MSLIDELGKAEAENTQGRSCQMCAAIDGIEDEVTRIALARAAGGTIGRDKLVRILNHNGLTVGRRAVERHRQEGHTS